MSNKLSFIRHLIIVAKKLLSTPTVFETNLHDFQIRADKNCKHNQPHIHVVDNDGKEEVFSLVDGKPIEGKVKNETIVLHFLADISNRRRLLRRFRRYQSGKKFCLLHNPNL